MEVEVQKLYYTYDQIHQYVRNISNQIKECNYKPDLIIAVGGGGYIPARILRSFIKVPLIGISLNFYNDLNQITDEPKILQWICEDDIKNKNVLIVDEIDDSRKTLDYIVTNFKQYNPNNISIAVIHSKLKEKVRNNFPIDFIGQIIPDLWVVYPWDNTSE